MITLRRVDITNDFHNQRILVLTSCIESAFTPTFDLISRTHMNLIKLSIIKFEVD